MCTATGSMPAKLLINRTSGGGREKLLSAHNSISSVAEAAQAPAQGWARKAKGLFIAVFMLCGCSRTVGCSVGALLGAGSSLDTVVVVKGGEGGSCYARPGRG